MTDRALEYLEAVRVLAPSVVAALEMAEGAIWPIARGEIVYLENVSTWRVVYGPGPNDHIGFGSWQNAYAEWEHQKGGTPLVNQRPNVEGA